MFQHKPQSGTILGIEDGSWGTGPLRALNHDPTRCDVMCQSQDGAGNIGNAGSILNART